MKRPSRQSLPHSRLTTYWNKYDKEKEDMKKEGTYKYRRPNVKRTPGKTKKFVKGAGQQVWVGKDVTHTGWMSEKKFKEMKK